MSYEIKLTAKAEQRLGGFSKEAQVVVARHLVDLSINPTILSRPSTPPAEPPGYQAYSFIEELSDGRHRFAVMFKYGSDESTLYVMTIGHVHYHD